MVIRLFDILHSYDMLNNYTIFDKFMNKIHNKEKNMIKYDQISLGRKSLNQKRSNSIACMRSVEYIEHLDRIDKIKFNKRSWKKDADVSHIYFDSEKPCMDCSATISIDNNLNDFTLIDVSKLKQHCDWLKCNSCNEFTILKLGIYVCKPGDVIYTNLEIIEL
jgi:hypothetical protein